MITNPKAEEIACRVANALESQVRTDSRIAGIILHIEGRDSVYISMEDLDKESPEAMANLILQGLV